jgi:hypothetical protein
MIEDPIGVLHHVPIHQPQHLVAQGLQVRGPGRIGRNRIGMTRAIDLQDQHCPIAEEVSDVSPARDLSAEFETVQLPIAQLRPQASFAIRLAAP